MTGRLADYFSLPTPNSATSFSLKDATDNSAVRHVLEKQRIAAPILVLPRSGGPP